MNENGTGVNDFVLVRGKKFFTKKINDNTSILKLNNLGISSPEEIKGLDKIKPFTYLHIQDNSLPSLPDLSHCPWILGITAHNNRIEKISNIPDNNKLEWLGLCNNPLKDVTGLKRCSSLKNVKIENTPLENLEGIENCKDLQEIWLSNNKIKDLSPLEGCDNLQILHLNNNQITSVKPLSELSKLGILHVENNQITSLEPLRNCP
ncbi:MAG: leucine-rich repeat domain-containing protein, partial [Promethearchaeota archaeon]